MAGQAGAAQGNTGAPGAAANKMQQAAANGQQAKPPAMAPGTPPGQGQQGGALPEPDMVQSDPTQQAQPGGGRPQMGGDAAQGMQGLLGGMGITQGNPYGTKTQGTSTMQAGATPEQQALMQQVMSGQHPQGERRMGPPPGSPAQNMAQQAQSIQTHGGRPELQGTPKPPGQMGRPRMGPHKAMNRGAMARPNNMQAMHGPKPQRPPMAGPPKPQGGAM